jgi:hypothetical protein
MSRVASDDGGGVALLINTFGPWLTAAKSLL